MIALISLLALAKPARIDPPAKADKPVTLAHVFTLNQKCQYEIKSHLQVQTRQMGLETFIPFDQDMSYTFTTQVTKLKADGIAEVHYLRPTVTEVEGETSEHDSITHVEKANEDLMLTTTPVNDVVDIKDLKPKKTPSSLLVTTSKSGQPQVAALGQFIQEVYQLAMFQGGLDSSLDFSPRLPLDEVSVGDTWKRTVSYQPQKLKGKKQQAVQRLDYTYTYQGISTWNGKKVYKISATLGLNTDLGDFFNQAVEATPEETGLKSLPLKLDANITFYLDFTSGKTVAADAEANGGFKIIVTSAPNDPVQEETVKGKTTLRLVGVSQAGTSK